jgi:hypothetical protein
MNEEQVAMLLRAIVSEELKPIRDDIGGVKQEVGELKDQLNRRIALNLQIQDEIAKCYRRVMELAQMRSKLGEEDDVFPDGVYSYPRNPNEPRVKVRKLSECCKEKGISSPADLSKEEMEQFLERGEQDAQEDYSK